MTIEDIIKQALLEDFGDGDHTSIATIAPHKQGTARLLVKEAGVICGIETAAKVFARVDDALLLTPYFKDGDWVAPGDIVFHIQGSARSILSAERTVLNFLQRLSGIATKTRQICDSVSEFPVKILDTRKTTPLLRQLEKYAVSCGGGGNHRMGLYDMIMIKDNHVDFAGGIPQAVKAVRDYLKRSGLSLKIEIEVRNFEELEQVMQQEDISRVMLDNFSPADLKKAVEAVGGRLETEASGGINEANIRDYAASGVDFISIGALTHHIKSLDLSLKADFR
jgi:nicotinate-nucleotide pyrophosphorylase (carboxylating)